MSLKHRRDHQQARPAPRDSLFTLHNRGSGLGDKRKHTQDTSRAPQRGSHSRRQTENGPEKGTKLARALFATPNKRQGGAAIVGHSHSSTAQPAPLPPIHTTVSTLPLAGDFELSSITYNSQTVNIDSQEIDALANSTKYVSDVPVAYFCVL